MRRIWILNPYDAVPGEAGYPQRFATLADVLAGRGHEVVWWSSDFSHAEKRRRAVAQVELSYQLRLVPTPPYERNVSLARCLSHRKWAAELWREAEQAVEGGRLKPPDLIVASMPPLETANLLRKLRGRWKAAAVMDIMDLWPDTFRLVLPRFLHPLLSLPKTRLKRAMKDLDGVSAQSEAFLDYARHLGACCPGHVCYLGALETKTSPKEVSPELRLVYLGTMGRVYDLETVILAVKQLREEGMPLSLELVGDGDKRPQLEALAQGNGAGIIFRGRLAGRELDEALNRAHLGLVPMFPDSGVVVPYKAGDYLARGLGIINSLPGELDGLLQSHGCGNRYEAGNVASLKDAIHYWWEKQRYLQVEQGATELFRKKFDRRITYVAFAEWLEELVDRNGKR